MEREGAPKASTADCEKGEAFERSGVGLRHAFDSQRRHEVAPCVYSVILGQPDKT